MCTASKQASKQSKAKSKIRRVSRLCKSQDYLLISRLQKISIMNWQHHHQNVVCRQIKFQSYSIYAGQQPPPSLTQPTSALEKTPKMYMSTGFANLNKKEAFPSVSKTPKMFANLYKKKKLSPSVAGTPKMFANLKIYIFSKCFELTKQLPFLPILYQQLWGELTLKS